MKNFTIIFLLWLVLLVGIGKAEAEFMADTVKTGRGDLVITFIGHGTLMFQFENRVIHVDPFSRLADYSQLPKADLILITHEHGDHLDLKAVEPIRTEKTVIVGTEKCAEKLGKIAVLKNGEEKKLLGLNILAVPAYNLVQKRENGQPFHPKGQGNGYVIGFGDKKVYIAGDSENIPELKSLVNIDIAFLPMNLPYTMTPEMVADAARTLKPKVLYPYHYGDTDTQKLVELLKDNPEIKVRIRPMQ